MNRRIRAISLLAGLLMLVAGCQKAPEEAPDRVKEETIKVFYGVNNERMAAEERRITYEREDDKYVKALEELIDGPDNPDYIANIKPDTVVYGVIRQKRDLIVDFSEHFSQFGGSMAEIIGVGSVVNTLTQFDGIDRVKILVEGNELIGLSGQPRGFMASFPLSPEETQVTLYFGDAQAMTVVGEKRKIDARGDREEFIKLVLEELIKGPRSQGLNATIPATVKVQSVAIEDGLARVDFSQEMHIDHWGGAAGEAMTINSIVNTLTEFEYIEEVLMTVDGQPMSIEHAILDEPIKRNEGMIRR